jgi:hypothetical protein
MRAKPQALIIHTEGARLGTGTICAYPGAKPLALIIELLRNNLTV